MNYKEMDLSPREKMTFYIVISLSGLLIGWLFYDNILSSAIAICLLVYTRYPFKEYLREKRNKELLMQFKDLLYSLTSSISVGRSIGQGLIESREFWKGTYSQDDYIMTELKEMEKKMTISRMTDIEVLEDFAVRSGLEDINDMVTACKTCKKTGGNMAEALSKCSNMISDKIALQEQLNTLLSQKKFEGRIVALAPMLIILIIRFTSPSYFQPMIETGAGRVITTISLVMIITGWLYIERVNNIEI